MSDQLNVQYWSHNQNYKAEAFLRPDTDKEFEVNVYAWSEDLSDEEGNPLWERVAGPLVVNDWEQARSLAGEHLSLIAGESVDESLTPEFQTEVRQTLADAEAVFLQPENFEVYFRTEDEDRESVSARAIVFSQEIYYVLDEKNSWMIGVPQGENQLVAWQRVESLSQLA